jgi:hypothetical protein
VISVEALWTLITLERTVIRSLLLMWWMSQHVRELSCMSTVEAMQDARMHKEAGVECV